MSAELPLLSAVPVAERQELVLLACRDILKSGS